MVSSAQSGGGGRGTILAGSRRGMIWGRTGRIAASTPALQRVRSPTWPHAGGGGGPCDLDGLASTVGEDGRRAAPIGLRRCNHRATRAALAREGTIVSCRDTVCWKRVERFASCTR